MSGAFEAAGDAMTGAVIAHAADPAHGKDSGHDSSACLNCGTLLIGSHCHNCGQAAHLHRSLMALWHDIAHGVFHFEGKVWRTVPLLAWRPGDLTRRYIHGERVRFVSPLALFLFCVFLTFAVVESVGGPFFPTVNRNGVKVSPTELKVEISKEQAKVAALSTERSTLIARGESTDAVDKRIKDTQENIEGLKATSKLADGISIDDLPSAIKIETDSPGLNERLKDALKNPKLLAYKLQSSAYKFAWALIPLSLPFMWLMFAWRPQYKLYDHAVFVTYSLCSVMLLFIVMALFGSLGLDMSWMILLIPVHFFVQLKQAYALRTFSALWRTFVLLNVTTVVLVVFTLLLLGLGLSG